MTGPIPAPLKRNVSLPYPRIDGLRDGRRAFRKSWPKKNGVSIARIEVGRSKRHEDDGKNDSLDRKGPRIGAVIRRRSIDGDAAFKLYDTYGLAARLHRGRDARRGHAKSIGPASIAPWRSSARARRLPGKACTRTSPTPPTPNSRKLSRPSRTSTSARPPAIAASKPSSRSKAR